MDQHLLQDAPADSLVGEPSVTPPPAIRIHLPRRSDDALHHFGEVGIGVVEAEDEAPAANPAQGQPLGTHVVLEHPVVAPWPREGHGPDGGQVGHPQGQARLLETRATEYSKAATRGNWNDVWSSFDARRKAKGEVSAANEAGDAAAEPDMFGGVAAE